MNVQDYEGLFTCTCMMILLHATSQHAYNTFYGHNCCKVLEHVLTFFSHKHVVKEVACDKIVPCKLALRL